jgi:hypothetical protein
MGGRKGRVGGRERLSGAQDLIGGGDLHRRFIARRPSADKGSFLGFIL